MPKKIIKIKSKKKKLRACKKIIKRNKRKLKNIKNNMEKEDKLYRELQRSYKKIKKEINDPSKSKYIKKINPDNQYQCIALTSKHGLCKQKVSYVHRNINKNNENYSNKKNALFCTRHMNLLLDSNDKLSLKHGFIFESDLYCSKITEYNS